MKKSLLSIFGILLTTVLVLTSCDETTEEYRFANWEDRNASYLDSIANVAKKDASGEWRILKSYTLPADKPGDLVANSDPTDYIYVKVLEAGNGISPLYNDQVRVHYRGMLINGDVFDQSYKGTLKPESAIPSLWQVSAVINGWTTALQQMKEGDRWEIYIPWTLAYGPTYEGGDGGTSDILPYSLLRFDISLVKVYPETEYNKDNPIPGWN